MQANAPRGNEPTLERHIVGLLRLGATAAGCFITAGLAAMSLGVWPGIGRGAAMVGLATLIVTPVSCVVAAGVGFLREKDYFHAAFSLVVLLFLVAGLLLGSTE